MMTILHIDASARTARSLTRRLSQRFVEAWLARRPHDRVIRRDLATDPLPHVTEAWIAACFTPPDQRSAAMLTTLAWSDAAIAELEAADLIVMGTPMYNYGMPSALKAWFDQVIRLGRTFSFDLRRGDWPIEPIMAGKRLVVLSARGEFGFLPGVTLRADAALVRAMMMPPNLPSAPLGRPNMGIKVLFVTDIARRTLAVVPNHQSAATRIPGAARDGRVGPQCETLARQSGGRSPTQ